MLLTTKHPELASFFDDEFLHHRHYEVERCLEMKGRFAATAFPTHVELGANRGAFIEGIGAVEAPMPTLGIEWRPKHVRQAERRIEKRGLTNVSMLAADAKLAFPLLFEPESLDAVYVLFPDPWWKARHIHRRLLDPVFLRVIARRLKPGGRVYLKSDVFDYLYWARASVEASGAFRPLPPERWPDEGSWTLSTREKKCMRAAIPFGRGYYERLADFDVTVPAQPESHAQFPVADDIDPVAIIQGRPPIDKEERARRHRSSQ
ncbi:MAG: tRNA (guanine-N7-)-methyltransferase [Bradymonadia bacterium]|jgi:tRNA (guanine-N7-)-methyltransferase